MFYSLRRKIYIGLILSITITLVCLSSLNCFLHMRLLYRDYIDKVTHNSEYLFSSIKINLHLVEDATSFFENKYDFKSILNESSFNYDFNRHMINLPNSNLHIKGAIVLSPNAYYYFSSGVYVNSNFKSYISDYIEMHRDAIHAAGKHWLYAPASPSESYNDVSDALFYILPLDDIPDSYLIVDTDISELIDSAQIRKSIFHNEALTYLKFENDYFILGNTLPVSINHEKLDNAASGSTTDGCLVSINSESNGYTIYDVVYLRYIYEQLLFIAIVALLLNIIVISIAALTAKPFVACLLNPLERLHAEMIKFTNDKITEEIL